MRLSEPLAVLYMLPLGLVLWGLYALWNRRDYILANWMPNSQAASNGAGVVMGLRVVGCLCLVLAATAPQLRTETTEDKQVMRQVVFLLDISNSMNAADVRPTRLDAAKNIIRGIVDTLKGDQFGLVVYANYAYVQCPPTTDHTAFLKLLEIANTQQFANHSSDLRAGLLGAAGVFEGLQIGQHMQSLVLLTDGEHFGDAYQSAVNRLARRGIAVFPVGIGTDAGTVIYPTEPPEAPDLAGPPAQASGVTKLQEAVLQALAAQFNTQYIRAGKIQATAIREILSAIRNQPPNETTTQTVREDWVEVYQYPLLVGLILLATSMFLLPRSQTLA